MQGEGKGDMSTQSHSVHVFQNIVARGRCPAGFVLVKAQTRTGWLTLTLRTIALTVGHAKKQSVKICNYFSSSCVLLMLKCSLYEILEESFTF